jgi:hypothetical protein
MNLPFSHPNFLWPTAALALLVLLLSAWAQLRPGLGVRVVGQSPIRLGLGLALVLGGLGLGLAEPRWGAPEVPRLTVHIVVDASRSMGVPDCAGQTRWAAALARLEPLWAKPQPGLRFAVDLLTGDDIPLLPPGEDRILLREALRAVTPGGIGSPGTSLGRGLPQVLSQVEPKVPAVLLLLSDGEETWETAEAALARAGAALKEAKLPLYALAFGSETPQAVPGISAGELGQEPPTSQARTDLLKILAGSSGGRLLGPKEDLGEVLGRLASGRAPLPAARSLQPAHPEWGAWLALAGFFIWLLAAGRPMLRWRPILGLVAVLGASSLQAEIPLPQDVKAWLAQQALVEGRLGEARRWRPSSARPDHRLLAAKIDLLSRNPEQALATLSPLTGLGAPRPLPPWRATALLLAARAQLHLGHAEEAKALLERLLLEQPGHREASHNLQTLVKSPSPPPPPNPKKPPPPPPPRPSMGAQQDELEGFKQKMPPPKPQGGIKDI